MRPLLCLLRLHAFRFVAWAEYGRGVLEKCARCPKARTRKVTLAELQAHLLDDAEELEERKRRLPKS